MQRLKIEQLQEELFYKKLANGLDVYILEKPEINKTFCTFTTKYGSIDNHFVSAKTNSLVKVPDGIAHFLEHKMFEKEDGDVFQKLSKQGANANAFTTFTRTAYLFSSTSNVEENLETLINFVQEPYFTDASVEKEKGIIGQEITMYDDDPDWRHYYQTIANMYHNHPVRIDIAGTVESIGKITKDMLYECYETFYHPQNMLLFVVGPVDANNILELVEKNQEAKKFKKAPLIERQFEEEPKSVAKKKETIEMNVMNPKVFIGVKSNQLGLKGAQLLKFELSIQIMFELLFGQSSNFYTEGYKEGILNDSFSFDFTQEENYGFGLIGGVSKSYETLSEKIKTLLLETKNKKMDEVELSRVKKKKIGNFLRAMNSTEFIANQFTRFAFNEMSLFDTVMTLEKLTMEEIKANYDLLIQEESLTECILLPKKA